MKAFFFSILLFASFNCFAQNPINQDSLKKAYLIKAHETPEYKEAVDDINQVKKNIELQKTGILTAADVVKDYNIRLGSHLGKKQTLKDVELRINSEGEKYPQYVLLLAAARLAKEDANKQE
ncbi:hypothetical protein [Mucilaginibacter sp.]|uniref:hypothetical protein n=1 Tax=Mucilaginibacter sp. TaxID=1882438 RepID=UPI00261D5CD9|nr:hypothetical protein [Mucilaginibacter sp.]MDB4926781.1 hypothetical protein [Mucilaginibacter sp.]